MILHHRRFNIAVYLVILVAMCDQMSKWWVIHELAYAPHAERVCRFFNLALVENHGITFGLLSRFNPHVTFYFFTGIAAVILVLLGRWLWRTNSTAVAAALGLIIGGALGNIVDRLRFGAVIDFLDFYVVLNGQDHHWPAFNLADSAIVTGVAVLLLDSLIRGR